jgi:Phytanoyl-CoA dioxygenase (PhyH)
MLTDDEFKRFHEDGLVVPAGFRLSDARIAALREGVEAVKAANPGVDGQRLIGPHLAKKVEGCVHGSRVFMDLAQDQDILDMVERIIGPDIILWSTHLFCKEAGTGKEVPWHQDGQYWPIRPLATCSVWVAIDDVTVENGAMRYVPGSHRMGHFRHEEKNDPDKALGLELGPGQLDMNLARHDTLAAGQVSLHDIHLVHGSAANRSNRRRAGYVMRYMPSTSHFGRFRPPGTKANFPGMPIFLMRGVDRDGRNDFAIGH